MLYSDTIERFRQAAIALGRTNDECDFTHEDVYANDMKEAIDLLRVEGKLIDLCGLHNDENDWVRLWAASKTLRFDTANSLEALRCLVEEDRKMVGFTAKYTIKGWHDGDFH
jgi:hypothetical protein